MGICEVVFKTLTVFDGAPNNGQDQQRGRLQMTTNHLPNGDGVAAGVFVVYLAHVFVRELYLRAEGKY